MYLVWTFDSLRAVKARHNSMLWLLAIVYADKSILFLDLSDRLAAVLLVWSRAICWRNGQL